MTFKFTLGVISFSLSVVVTLLNSVIFVPVFRLAFIEKKSTVYIIAFFNIISDFLQLFTTGLTLSASMIADRYLFTGERINTLSIIIGGIFINGWYMECLIQIVMAVNRFTVITLNKQHIFTFESTLVIFFFLTSFTTFSAVCTQYLFPCCMFIMDQNLMTFLFIQIEGVYSYSNLMLVSYDILCTTVSTLCYIGVFISIRKAKAAVSTNVQSNRSKQDSRFLLQFVLIALFYDLAWVLFEVLPFLVPADHLEWFAVVPVLVTLNCSTCAIIYLTMNKDIQRSVQVPWLRKMLEGPKASSQAATSQAVSLH